MINDIDESMTIVAVLVTADRRIGRSSAGKPAPSIGAAGRSPEGVPAGLPAPRDRSRARAKAGDATGGSARTSRLESCAVS